MNQRAKQRQWKFDKAFYTFLRWESAFWEYTLQYCDCSKQIKHEQWKQRGIDKSFLKRITNITFIVRSHSETECKYYPTVKISHHISLSFSLYLSLFLSLSLLSFSLFLLFLYLSFCLSPSLSALFSLSLSLSLSVPRTV